MSASIFNDGQPIDWGKPDSFVTAFMGALSMSFPVGETFFIDSIKKGYSSLPGDLKEQWKSEIDRFCKEEENHSKAHFIHNEKNRKTFGFVNHWYERSEKRIQAMSGKNSKHYVASTAAVEHITTIMACWLLLNQHILHNAPDEVKKLWLWHAAEEIGHRKVAIDLYRDLNGLEIYRIKWMKIMYILTAIDTIRQTINNIWHMGGFFKLSTWVNAYKLMFSKNGVMRWSYPYFKAYGQENYHISQDQAMIDMALKSK
jgi:predicted metal-dependent hydrolase